jgi:hypothetical protein
MGLGGNFMKSQTLPPPVLRKAGLDALAKKLGPLGMVRFLQQYESGSGDYTREREQWLKDVELDDILEHRAKRRGRFTP